MLSVYSCAADVYVWEEVAELAGEEGDLQRGAVIGDRMRTGVC
jgi:hypothetical protein